MYKNRYIYDSLYGALFFPEYVWDLLVCPELQRLREVRLCNINSLCLTGGANINRYEHVVGTAALALQCVSAWPGKLAPDLQRRIVLAALLHDVGTAPFGHSVQYVLQLQGYRHESLYDLLGSNHASSTFQYQKARFEPVYFGLPKQVAARIPDAELREISEIVEGRGDFGPIINGTIDLDNLDNVYRLAYHIGLVKSGATPSALAKSIWVYKGRVKVKPEAVEFLNEWYTVRRRLYHYLLLNPDEFSAKCMLEDALFLSQARSTFSFAWHQVDFELLEKLGRSTAEVSPIVSRLMVGNLYGCVGIYAMSKIAAYDVLVDPKKRENLREKIQGKIRKMKHRIFKSAEISIHAIKDVNKTERQIKVLMSNGKEHTIGRPSRRILIGVFFRNVHLSMNSIRPDVLREFAIPETIRKILARYFADRSVKAISPYDELSRNN